MQLLLLWVFILLVVSLFLRLRTAETGRVQKANNAAEEEKAVRNHLGVAQDRWVTHVYHTGPTKDHPVNNPENHRVAGEEHVKNCLTQLVSDGVRTKRKIILPPPHAMLDPMHNMGKNVTTSSWDTYFDLTKLKSTGLVETNPIFKHGQTPGTFTSTIDNVEVVHPDDSFKDRDLMLVISYFDGDDVSRYTCNGMHSGGILSWDERDKYNLLDIFPPSTTVVNAAHHIAKTLGSYDAIHIRRGDVVAPTYKGPYEGMTGDQMRKMTHVDHVINVIDNSMDKSRKLIVFTNERDPVYLAKLKERGVILESDIPELANLQDNYMRHMIAKCLFRMATVRISTVRDKMGPSNLYLKDTI